MSRFDDLLTQAFDEIAERATPSPAARERLHARVAEQDQQRREEVVVMLAPVDRPDQRPRWIIPAVMGAAVAVVVLVAGVLTLRSGIDDVATVTDPVPEDTARSADPVVRNWMPVLAGVTASAPPVIAECPAGSLPALDDDLVLPDFFRYDQGSSVYAVSAAYDSGSHSVVVLGMHSDESDAWVVGARLDVCSGTWSPMNADFGTHKFGGPVLPWSLVYDVDSDALVAFTPDGVRVHDPAADEWVARPDTVALLDTNGKPADMNESPRMWWHPRYGRAVYHPASGMIIAAHEWLAAYDVENAEWHWISYESAVGFTGDFLGINTELDQFIFDGWTRTEGQLTRVAHLVDPVTGQATNIPVPGSARVVVNDELAPRESFGQAIDTVFVTNDDNTICGFDATTFAWSTCVELPRTLPGPAAAIVEDPQNNQLIVIAPTGEIWTAPMP